jgi:hypothetical protein
MTLPGQNEHHREDIHLAAANLEIAVEALCDIATGSGDVKVTDEMLASKESFREAFASLLQGRARKALTDLGVSLS